jgi:hypothetical protein
MRPLHKRPLKEWNNHRLRGKHYGFQSGLSRGIKEAFFAERCY